LEIINYFLTFNKMTWRSTAYPMPYSCLRRCWFIAAIVQSATVTLPLTSAPRSRVKNKLSLSTSRTSSRRPSRGWRRSRWEITPDVGASASGPERPALQRDCRPTLWTTFQTSDVSSHATAVKLWKNHVPETRKKNTNI
jgi:hypothetical protein